MLSPTTTASGAAIGHVGPTSSLLHYLNPADDEHSLRQLLGPTSHGPLRSTTNELFEHRIILSLSHLPPLLSSLDKFMECSRGDVVMLPVVRMMANRLLPLSKRMLDSPSSEELCTLTTTLDINTSRDIKLDPSATAIELINACTGTMLRWETLGIVFAATALCVSRFSVTLSVPNQKGELLENLLTASHDCLLKGGHTFLSTWHMHQDLVARIWLQDTCNPDLWHRLGRLSAVVIGQGLHQQKLPSDLLGFLDHLLLRLFGMIYEIDKTIAAYCERPPTLRARYCKIHLPPKIDDNSLYGLPGARICASGNDVQEAQNLFIPDDIWITARILTALSRGEILEIYLVPIGSVTAPKLERVRKLVEANWIKMPEQVRCSTDIWNTCRPIEQNCLLQLNLLDHLSNNFLIEKTNGRSETWSNGSLVHVAHELLANSLTLALQRSRLRHLQLNVPKLVSTFALPAAVILAESLNRNTSSTVPKSSVIKDLSVFMSCTDWMYGSPVPEAYAKSVLGIRQALQNRLSG